MPERVNPAICSKRDRRVKWVDSHHKHLQNFPVSSDPRIACAARPFPLSTCDMPGFADGRYNDGNRAFLQAFLAQSSLTLETARPILAAISTCEEGREVLAEDINVEDLNTYISEANRKLLPLDLEIRSTFHQHTRERVYALINTTSDPLTQLATTYTPDEIIYVKKLLDAMFDSRNNKGRREAMCVSGIEAIQTGRNQDNRRETQNGSTSQSSAGMLGPRDAESMLNRLLAEGWLEKSRAGFYGLSPRALMELKSWLVDTYNEDDDGEIRDKIKFCHACKEVITVVRPRLLYGVERVGRELM